jgi:hypothetical protein
VVSTVPPEVAGATTVAPGEDDAPADGDEPDAAGGTDGVDGTSPTATPDSEQALSSPAGSSGSAPWGPAVAVVLIGAVAGAAIVRARRRSVEGP